MEGVPATVEEVDVPVESVEMVTSPAETAGTDTAASTATAAAALEAPEAADGESAAGEEPTAATAPERADTDDIARVGQIGQMNGKRRPRTTSSSSTPRRRGPKSKRRSSMHSRMAKLKKGGDEPTGPARPPAEVKMVDNLINKIKQNNPEITRISSNPSDATLPIRIRPESAKRRGSGFDPIRFNQHVRGVFGSMLTNNDLIRIAAALTYSVDEIQLWIEETFDFSVLDDPTILPSEAAVENEYRFGVTVEGDL